MEQLSRTTNIENTTWRSRTICFKELELIFLLLSRQNKNCGGLKQTHVIFLAHCRPLLNSRRKYFLNFIILERNFFLSFMCFSDWKKGTLKTFRRCFSFLPSILWRRETSRRKLSWSPNFRNNETFGSNSCHFSFSSEVKYNGA